MNTSSSLGMQAERFVAHQLEQQGFIILAQNYKKTYGEIDIIAQQKNLIVFVEVKMRTTDYFDSAELITYTKQRKIITTASTFLAEQALEDSSCRFDVALVSKSNNEFSMTYLTDAFQA
jgi:putative endonuclease